MSADVQYMNTGPIRRTVLGVRLVMHTPEMDNTGCELLGPVPSAIDAVDPVYIEPNTPVVLTYRVATDKVSVSNTIYGLQIRSLDKNDQDNWVTIFAMKLMLNVGGFTGIAQLRPRAEKISLDKYKWSFFMPDFGPTPPSESSPDKGASPH